MSLRTRPKRKLQRKIRLHSEQSKFHWSKALLELVHEIVTVPADLNEMAHADDRPPAATP